MATAQDTVRWLVDVGNQRTASLIGRITEVEAVEVTLGKETFQGARYRQDGDVRFYLLGELPKEKKRHPRSVCWTMDGNDWYVACYYQDSGSEHSAYQELQPFGHNFILMMWDVVACKGAKIDTGERWTYKRFPMSVKVL